MSQSLSDHHLQVVLTTRKVVASSENDWLVPVSQSGFPATCKVGETLVLGEYLTAGAERSSLYLTVSLCPNTWAILTWRRLTVRDTIDGLVKIALY